LNDEEIEGLVVELAQRLLDREHTLSVAESCTGGWIAKQLTDVPGSSAWFDRGYVTYCNRAKVEMLGVPLDLLQEQGAVSQAVVEAMADGVLRNSPAHCALAVSGIAGPGGGTVEKPVGTVWLAWAFRGVAVDSRCCHFSGNREQIRQQAVAESLKGLLARLSP
jgi:nicotinamide-nucleotide amidase